MTDKEKQIEEMTKIISEMYSVYDTTAEDIAQGLFEKGYRKMDEVTLKLDLGDRSAEEIKQIAEAFNGDIKKQVAKKILDEVLKLVEEARLESEFQNDKGEWIMDEHEFMSEFTLGSLTNLYTKYGLKFYKVDEK